MVFAQNTKLPFTTCAAASSFDPEDALDHALKEVESAVFCKLFDYPTNRAEIKPQRVRLTSDHGTLYEQRHYFRCADFFHGGPQEGRLAKMKAAALDWADLTSRFATRGMSILAVDLGTEEAGTLRIAKVFVPGLIPISFGFREEPCGMDRIFSVPVFMKLRRNRLNYGQLNRFPHPYT
jgi:ribosomal protein S12 methylthiotransferase accessory factor